MVNLKDMLVGLCTQIDFVIALKKIVSNEDNWVEYSNTDFYFHFLITVEHLPTEISVSFFPSETILTNWKKHKQGLEASQTLWSLATWVHVKFLFLTL